MQLVGRQNEVALLNGKFDGNVGGQSRPKHRAHPTANGEVFRVLLRSRWRLQALECLEDVLAHRR